MALLQFLAQNIHFAIGLFTALACLAVFWLIFDAWTGRKEWKDFLKWVGFLLLALAFLIYAAVINQSSFGYVAWGHRLSVLSEGLRIMAYILIVVGQLIDPLQPVPKNMGLQLSEESATSAQKAPGLLAFGTMWQVLLPVGSLTVALCYFRRATKGLERHLRPVSISFMWLSGFELFSLANALWQTTANPILYRWVEPFGYFWILAHICLLMSGILLTRWVWAYLLERLQSQLFMIFTTITTFVFLIATVSFTYLLMNNVQQSSLANLRTSSLVLQQALNSKSQEMLADAEVLSENQSIIAATQADNHQELSGLTNGYLAQKHLSSFIITNENGEVLDRGDYPDLWGQSVSSDPLLQRSLLGFADHSIVTHHGVLAPSVAIEAATPIYASTRDTVGVVITEQTLDNAFLDGIKHVANLDSAIYAGNVASSTTFLTPDGKSRWVGLAETNAKVKKQVLLKGQIFNGPLQILNSSYLVSFSPLKDVNNVTVGMLLTAQPQVTLLHTIAHSVELTFIFSVGLIAIMILPAFILSKRIARQLQ